MFIRSFSSVIRQTADGFVVPNAADWAVCGGMAVACVPDVRPLPPQSTYAEPTLMWRLRNSNDGRHAYSVIVPSGSKATAGWFSQGILQESHTFATWHEALCWLDKKLETLRLHSWLVDDDD